MSGHLEDSGLRKAHAKALRLSKVQPFVLYSFRHTFATCIAPHVDAWTLCKIMGWASLGVAMRYIHPSEERVLAAFGQQPTPKPDEAVGGSNSGSSQPITDRQPVLELAATISDTVA
jgi:hypothetical protein